MSHTVVGQFSARSAKQYPRRTDQRKVLFFCEIKNGPFFPKIENGMSSDAFAQHVLQQGKVAVVPGSERWFGKGAEGHIRICFSTSKEILEEGLNRIIKSF